MLTNTREGRPTFGFGLWKSVYLLPVPAPGIALTQLVPLTFYAGGHPTTRLSDDGHAGFVVNATLDFFVSPQSNNTLGPATVSIVGSWAGATAVSHAGLVLKPGPPANPAPSP